jgi:hypothetical protein
MPSSSSVYRRSSSWIVKAYPASCSTSPPRSPSPSRRDLLLPLLRLSLPSSHSTKRRRRWEGCSGRVVKRREGVDALSAGPETKKRESEAREGKGGDFREEGKRKSSDGTLCVSRLFCALYYIKASMERKKEILRTTVAALYSRRKEENANKPGLALRAAWMRSTQDRPSREYSGGAEERKDGTGLKEGRKMR